MVKAGGTGGANNLCTEFYYLASNPVGCLRCLRYVLLKDTSFVNLLTGMSV